MSVTGRNTWETDIAVVFGQMMQHLKLDMGGVARLGRCD